MGLLDRINALAASLTGEAEPPHQARPVALSPCEQELMRALSAPGGDANAAHRLSLLFSGDVQGVGFRWTNQRFAQQRNLTGWAQNLADGTVRMEIQGAACSLAAHLERIHASYASLGNRIWLEEAHELELLHTESGFEVRY